MRALLPAAAVALQLAVPAGASAAPGPAAPRAAPKAAAALPEGWARLDAQDAGFTAAFPGVPERLAHVTSASRMVIYEVGTADERSFVAMVVFGEAGQRIVEEMLVPSLQEDAKVVADLPVKLDGHAATAVRARGEAAEVALRRLSAFDRHYLLAVRAPAGQPFPDAEARAFFDSFRFRPGVTVPDDLVIEDEDDEDDGGAWAHDSPPPVLPPARLAQGFRPFEARDAGFAVKFPGEPTREEDGASIEYGLEGGPGACDFSVLTFPRVEENTAAALDAFVTELAGVLGSAMTRNEKVTLAGVEGRAVSLAVDDQRVEARILRGDRSMYVLIVGGSGATPAQPDLDAFFGSFRVVK